MSLSVAALACAVLAAQAGPSQDSAVYGARGVTSSRPGNRVDPTLKFLDDVQDYSDRCSTISPEKAAEEWLGLARTLVGDRNHDSEFLPLIHALPPPAGWPLIERAITANGLPKGRDRAILLLLEILQGKNKEALASIAALEADPAVGSQPQLAHLKLGLAIRDRDPDRLESLLMGKGNIFARPEGMAFTDMEAWSGLPDLVPLMGEKRAAKVLTYLLLHAKSQIIFSTAAPVSSTTVSLARKLLRQNIDQIAYPQWSLACSTEAGHSFLTFKKRFQSVQELTMSSTQGPLATQTAAGYCLLNMFLSGDIQEARQFAISNADDLSVEDADEQDVLRRSGKLEAFRSFLHRLAVSHPDSRLPIIDATFAIEDERPQPAESALKRVALGTRLGRNSQAGLILWSFLLNHGLLADAASLVASQQRDLSDFGIEPEDLIALSRLVKRRDLVRLAIREGLKSLQGGAPFLEPDLQAFLVRHGYRAAIQRLLVANLRRSVSDASVSWPPASRDAATQLAKFYYRIGRYRDVVTLLEKFPGREVGDLSELAEEGNPDRALLSIAAISLAKVGRAEEARRVVAYDLKFHPTDDEDYELLLKLDPNADRVLQTLTNQFPHEPRPMIWWSEFLQRLESTSSAEFGVRRAIAMDPDDLEAFGDKHRFLAYRVLSEIHPPEAPRYAKLTECAVIAEKANRLDQLGLWQQAIRAYRSELRRFPEDLGARVRLGLLILHLGKRAEGVRQIEQAFGNIPPHIVPNPWYVYVVTAVLADSDARFAAAKALQALVKTGSASPSVYSMLGTIQDQEGDVRSAIASYTRATKLDPDNQVAWRGLGQHADIINPDLALSASLNLARLGAPLDYFIFERLSYIPDYGRAYLQFALATVGKRSSPPRVFALKASRLSLQRSTDQSYIADRLDREQDGPHHTPGAFLASDRLIYQCSTLIDAISN